jgi:hypothetical protein
MEYPSLGYYSATERDKILIPAATSICLKKMLS